MKKFTYVDLFSGAGGLSVGFGREDFHLLMANDIDNQALDTLRHNLSHIHPETETSHIIHGDITELYKHLGGKKVKEKFSIPILSSSGTKAWVVVTPSATLGVLAPILAMVSPFANHSPT